MSHAFRLIGLEASIDDTELLTCSDNEREMDAESSVKLGELELSAGTHELDVELLFRGHGYGIFSYIRDYRFEVSEWHEFEVSPGQTTRIEVIAYEQGCEELEDRPQLRFVMGEETQGDTERREGCPWIESPRDDESPLPASENGTPQTPPS